MMAELEWYRRDTWTDADREHFFQKLKRARSTSRGQYLKIQAYHLARADFFSAAIELLNLMIADYPERIFLAQAWTQLAECKAALSDDDGAIAAYRNAIKQMRVVTNVLTTAFQDYPLMVAVRELRQCFEEAKELLYGEEAKSALFAVGGFKIHAARAMILNSEGDGETARSEALLALDYAEVRKSGIVYHQNIGLVGNKHADVLKRVLAIVGTH
jgi:hypothetical protein